MGGIVSVPAPASASGLRLSITAGVATGTPAYREWRGSIALTVPFDAFFAANDSAPHSSRAHDGISEPPSETSEEPAAGGDTKMDGDDGHSPPESPQTPPEDRLVRLDPRLARKTVAVALRVAGIADGKRRVLAMAGRARTAALLPELRISGGRSTDQSLRLSPTSSDPYRYTETGGHDLYAEASLTWRLDRLVFADAELAVERLVDGRYASEMKLVAQVLAELFSWQRARVRQADASLEPEQRALAALDEIEAEATLDVLTDGWFSRKVSKGVSNP